MFHVRVEALVSLRHSYLGSLFLGPEYMRKLNIGAIRKFAKGTGYKGPVLRPRCIGPGKVRTQTPFHSIPI